MISLAKRIRAVLFDWGGTLVDSEDVKVPKFGGLFHQGFGLSSQKVEEPYRHHSGILRRQLFDTNLQDMGKPNFNDEVFNNLIMKFSELNTKALSNPVLPGLLRPSTPILLKYLQEKGWFLYVSSSTSTTEFKEIAFALDLAHSFLDSEGDIMGTHPSFNKDRDYVNFFCKKHGHPRSKIIPYFLTFLGCPSPKKDEYSVRPKRFVSLKRRLGMLKRRGLGHFFPFLAWKLLDEEKKKELPA